MKTENFKSNNGIVKAAILFMLFALYTVAVMFIDVQPVGPVNPATGEASSVGFATLNIAVHSMLGESQNLYQLTEYVGYGVLAVAALFAFVGLCQMIGRRGIGKIDPNILVLGCLYAFAICFYILFEIACVNYRPMIMEGELEASYPSSHTMLVICVMATLPKQFEHYFKDRLFLCGLVHALSVIVCLFMVLGRLACGCHWFTDILGSLILSWSMIVGYRALIARFCKNF